MPRSSRVLCAVYTPSLAIAQIWGGGWLASRGVKDFAGGIVIHATAGSSSLVACAVLGTRVGHNKKEECGGFPYSNIVTSTIGASILWMG